MRRLASLVIAFALAALVVPIAPPLTAPAGAYPSSHVQLEGAGWGHGRGMGQFGALGYAVNHGWSYRQILGHFYGNTGVGSIGNPRINVRLTGYEAASELVVILTGHGGSVATSMTSGSHGAVLVRARVESGPPDVRVRYDVWTGPGCGGGWNHRGTRTIGNGGRPGIGVSSSSGIVQVCESDGDRRSYRGTIQVTHDSEGPPRTVNRVRMQRYLRGVVPRESPASWGDAGDGKGMEALKAQAVAARSYARSEGRYSYAHTCDTTACQVYGGVAFNGTTLEHSNTNAAVDQTSGEIRTRNGSVQRTEFSSSTGGWTAGGTFPAVEDRGDSISANPNHRWTASVPVGSIESAYSSIGTLRAVDVTGRNGKGVWGGRVVEVVLRGTNGSRTISGNEFRSRFGLKSDWFRVVNTPSGGVSGYWVLDSAGGIFTFGNANYYGSVPGLRQQGHQIGRAEIVDVASTPSGNGYWVLDGAGGIFSFGDARFHGSVPGLRRQGIQVGRARIISLAPTRSGNGYWILDSAGGMFAFGDAKFHGSVPALREAGHRIGPADIVAMTPNRSGSGYWVIDDVGGVFAFGGANFHGSLPALRQAGVNIGRADVVDLAASSDGYWMLDHRGGLFAFGDARFRGSLPGAGISARAVGIEPTKTGNGYLIASAAGARVHPFGDAPDFGDVAGLGISSTGRGIAVRYRR